MNVKWYQIPKSYIIGLLTDKIRTGIDEIGK